MINATESALHFVDGRARADLDADLLLVFALVRAVEIIGEAASQVRAIPGAFTNDPGSFFVVCAALSRRGAPGEYR